MDTSDVISTIAIAASLATSIMAISVSVRNFRRTKKFEEDRTYRDKINGWGVQVIDVMSEANALCLNELQRKHDESQEGARIFSDRKSEIQTRLSSLLDQGRLYIPNTGSKAYGTEKEPAFRGFRQEELSCIAAVLDCVDSLSFNDAKNNAGELRKEIVKCKRTFTSCMQRRMDTHATFAKAEELDVDRP